MFSRVKAKTIGGKYVIETSHVPPQGEYPVKFKLDEGEDYLRTRHSAFDVGEGGDAYWTSEIISRTHFQAETGRIPVSGAGYGGLFAGTGFDSMWMDMSEIVRPTRDCIHGREYSSTGIDLGRKAPVLKFDKKGGMLTKLPKNMQIPLPVVFKPLPLGHVGKGADVAVVKAASMLGTLAIVEEDELDENLTPYLPNICINLKETSGNFPEKISKVPMVQLDGLKAYRKRSGELRERNPRLLVSVVLPPSSKSGKEVVTLFQEGIDVVHLQADCYGMSKEGVFIKDTVEEVHDLLVAECIRDNATLLTSGGIADAEHIPKIMVCGADCVAIDYPLAVALGCGLWTDTRYPCMFEHKETNPDWGAARIMNLMAAWRNQMLEVMGAMGLREIRRMRGERGRAIFYEREEKAFMRLFKNPGSKVTYPRVDSRYSMGDCRWTPELIRATFEQARTGRPPTSEKHYKVGASGGGFDRLKFVFERDVEEYDLKSLGKIDVSIDLNKRKTGKKIKIPYPVYMGGMSFGSISINVMKARAKAAQKLGTFVSTGEGGYPDELIPYRNNIITQVATGLFGVSEETIKRVRIMEFKYAQGAKPGLGGHLLAYKVTDTVAQARESVSGRSLFSPFPFHSVYSVEDHKKHVDWVKSINPGILTVVKVSTPTDVDMVAVGSYYAGANVINLDGSYGGTGAAPEISKKNIAMPIEYAINRVHKFLLEEGVRDKVTLMASGGLRSAWDVAKAIALGADGAMVGTADIVALGCERMGRCEKGDGCPTGITTTNPELAKLIDPEWGFNRVYNMHSSWKLQLQHITKNLGLKRISDLTGRTDLLEYGGGV